MKRVFLTLPKKAFGLRSVRIALSVLLSGLITWGIVRMDSRASMARDFIQAQGVAQQLLSQIESLSIYAKSQGERDPIRWSIDRLHQGKDPRVIEIRKESDISRLLEGSAWDPASGAFWFSRVLSQEERAGARVDIPRPYRGFAGTGSRLSSDLIVLLISALIARLLNAIFSRASGNVLPAQGRRIEAIQERTRGWLKESKQLLLVLGASVKEVIRHAHDLTVATSKARAQVAELRTKIHEEIRAVRETRSDLKKSADAGKEIEVMALNLVLEASRMGEKGSRFGKMAEALHQQVQKLRRAAEHADGSVLELEKRLEPISTDADLAFHSFDGVFEITQGMDRPIRTTSETMLAQAKLIQNSNNQLSGKSQ